MRFISCPTSAAALPLLAALVCAACSSGPFGECRYGGHSYAAGASFPGSDGCNSCACSAGGQVACTTRACVDAGPQADAGGLDTKTDGGDADTDGRTNDAPVCMFGATYKLTKSHGLNPSTETATLTPPAALAYENRVPYADAGNASCMPPLPACNDPVAVDVGDVEADVADPDVQQALAQATPPHFGTECCDQNESSFRRADGRGFSIGEPECAPGQAKCAATPAGIHRLHLDLQALVARALQDPACAGLH